MTTAVTCAPWAPLSNQTEQMHQETPAPCYLLSQWFSFLVRFLRKGLTFGSPLLINERYVIEYYNFIIILEDSYQC